MVCIEKTSDIQFNVNDKILLVPITSNGERNGRISCLFISNITSGIDYVVGQYHNDLKTVNIEDFFNINWPTSTYCFGQNYKNKFIDIELLHWIKYNDLFLADLTNKIKKYIYWYSNYKNVYDVVPIVLIFEYFEEIKSKFCEKLQKVRVDNEYYDTFKVYSVFFELNKNIIQLDKNSVKEHFDLELDCIYPNYNFYTLTGRPSNSSAGINLAALNKKTGVRDIITANNEELLIEFDYDSFHIRLIANLIGYKLPETNLHEYFGRQYFNSAFLTEEQYEKSKTISFGLIYGYEDSTEYNIEFFNRVYEFRNDLWDSFNKNGYVLMPISKRKLRKRNFKNITRNKLFNYMLQGYETEFNSQVLKKILNYLYKRNSEFVLYTYDSFLFKYNKKDGLDFIKDLLQIFNTDNMSVSVKSGKSYNSMIKRKINGR